MFRNIALLQYLPAFYFILFQRVRPEEFATVSMTTTTWDVSVPPRGPSRMPRSRPGITRSINQRHGVVVESPQTPEDVFGTSLLSKFPRNLTGVYVPHDYTIFGLQP